MTMLRLTWEGPFSAKQVIFRMTDGGRAPAYDGHDYGLYQVYGRHILGDRDALLYVGEATQQTFSARFRQHQSWLANEWPVRVYLGRMYLPRRHSAKDHWAGWRADLLIAERLMIYKYSPHYNSVHVAERPLLFELKRIVLIHEGKRHRLQSRDVAPDDWQ
jgi:hypothetical protein